MKISEKKLKRLSNLSKTKKKFAILGIIISIIIIIYGIFAATMSNPSYTSYNNTPSASLSSIYDHGYAKFGADYYTYSVNNTADAAEAAHDAADATRGVGSIVAIAANNIVPIDSSIDFLIIALGMISLCFFGVKLGEYKIEEYKDYKKYPENYEVAQETMYYAPVMNANNNNDYNDSNKGNTNIVNSIVNAPSSNDEQEISVNQNTVETNAQTQNTTQE